MFRNTCLSVCQHPLFFQTTPFLNKNNTKAFCSKITSTHSKLLVDTWKHKWAFFGLYLEQLGDNFRTYPFFLFFFRDGSGYQNRWFFGKVPKGRGVIFNPKDHNADFGSLNRACNRAFLRKKCNMIFQKWGGGSKAVWNFFENSSVLVSSPVP